ncbi:MAG: hypothetical protein MSA89_05445 [Clostridium sp.]|nr:hypothetical protein [Clostridium sp.]
MIAQSIASFIFLLFFSLTLIFILFAPLYALGKFLIGFSKSNNKIINRIKKFFNNFFLYSIYIFIGTLSCIISLIRNNSDVKAGNPITIYSNNLTPSTVHQSISSQSTISIFIILFLGIISFFILKCFSEKLSPIIYVLFSSLLILNVIFTIIYIIQVWGHLSGFNISMMLFGLITLNLFYLDELRTSLNLYIENELNNDRVYKNKLIFTLRKFTLNFRNIAITWAIFLFPLVLIIQLICILFGQTPTSLIDAFLHTSSYNLSNIPAPEPIILEYDGHYLCTVSVKGHKKLVKPLRYGIRHGHKIMVNRQLLIANAFENILEQYTPRLHKIIRNFYDKYGYPLSKHINTKLSADIIYILMKPLEWIFLFVLYTVDKHPEDRINVQYSELRK